MIIAIDGPAASGKGTLARNLADQLGLRHLDSGALYRAVALQMLLSNQDPEDEALAAAAAWALEDGLFGDSRLRDEATGKAASKVARYPDVRQALLEFQRNFAHTPPGAVIDGRDIGTVVCPQADVKLFVTAGSDVRAARRALELEARGQRVDRAALRAEIEARDRQDRERIVAPLVRASDAVLLDTSDLDIEAALAAALNIIRDKGFCRP